MLLNKILSLLFPPKCVLCGKLLADNETDLCHSCRIHTAEFTKSSRKISFVAGWTSLWYYGDVVRDSLLRFKFSNRRSYGTVYGRLLAMKLLSKPLCEYDLLTWVPVSRKRQRQRGYDQVSLIARSLGRELGTPAVCVLRKHRHTPPQSGITDASQRRANILGAYTVEDPTAVRGKRILLVDDIITSGATVSECARTLLTAGAKEVWCVCVATPCDKKKNAGE